MLYSLLGLRLAEVSEGVAKRSIRILGRVLSIEIAEVI